MMSGVAGTAEPVGPVTVGGEFLAPPGEIEADFARVVRVFQAVVSGVGRVRGGARIVVNVSFPAHSGGGRVLLDVKNCGAIVAGGGDVFAAKMIAP